MLPHQVRPVLVVAQVAVDVDDSTGRHVPIVDRTHRPPDDEARKEIDNRGQVDLAALADAKLRRIADLYGKMAEEYKRVVFENDRLRAENERLRGGK